jgi:hypothetical protein
MQNQLGGLKKGDSKILPLEKTMNEKEKEI